MTVTVRRGLGRRGVGRRGCLVWIVLVAAVGYWGYPIGVAYYKYWNLRSEMKVQARLAPGVDDASIQRRILRKVEELGLPDEARRITVRRTARPREIVIRTQYEVTIVLPFYTRTLTLEPEARQPL